MSYCECLSNKEKIRMAPKSICRRVAVVVGVVTGIVASIIAILALAALIRAATLTEIDYNGNDASSGLVQEELPKEYLDTLPSLFAKSLTFKTVSTAPGEYNREQLVAFNKFLRESFPNVFNSTYIEAETVNNYSLLLTIKGSDDSLEPYMLASHMDVVPADASKWSHDPFGGEIIPDPVTGKDVIWGRGAIDVKFGLMGILMSLEHLTTTDWKPMRTFYVGFGHDEEVGGGHGAQNIAALLKERGVSLEFLMDEGMVVFEDIMPGIDVPVACIGVSEKGYMTLRIEASGDGGHSSMPPLAEHSAVGRLTKALYKLQQNPQPSQFGSGPEEDMLAYIAPKTSWPMKFVYGNTWLFKGIIQAVMSRSRETNAVIRTTTAVTIIEAGVKENVIPSSASAIVNHRVHPGQSLDEVLEHDKAVIDDPQVKITVLNQTEGPPISPYGPKAAGFRLIAANVAKIFPNAISIPSIMVANTDTKYYSNFTRNIYRFMPIHLTKKLVSTIHGNDERISVSGLLTGIKFYHRLIQIAESDLNPHKSPSVLGMKENEL